MLRRAKLARRTSLRSQLRPAGRDLRPDRRGTLARGWRFTVFADRVSSTRRCTRFLARLTHAAVGDGVSDTRVPRGSRCAQRSVSCNAEQRSFTGTLLCWGSSGAKPLEVAVSGSAAAREDSGDPRAHGARGTRSAAVLAARPGHRNFGFATELRQHKAVLERHWDSKDAQRHAAGLESPPNTCLVTLGWHSCGSVACSDRDRGHN